MPTALRFGGMRVVVYPNDHRPAHVHVVGAGKEAVFTLNCPSGPPELRTSYGFGHREVNRINESLTQALQTLCDEWRKIHGGY